MKKILPILLAAAAFIVVLLVLSPTPEEDVLVAAYDLPMGHVVVSSDFYLGSFPNDMIPDDAIKDPELVVGKTLMVGRSEGDIIRVSNLGDEPMALAPNERAVAVTVNNASGMAGLLRPGDLVGLTAVIDSGGIGEQGTYSKAAVENLRVLYLSPDFLATEDSTNVTTTTTDNTTATTRTERKPEGALVLAVPINAETIVYNFEDVEPELGVQERVVNVIEMLTALEASENAKLFMYLMPRDAETMVTSGLWLPELIIKPYKPTPTLNPLLLETPVPGVPVLEGGQ
jgi:pilus assembly protein CpaB